MELANAMVIVNQARKIKEQRDEIERLREALSWIASCEGGDIFDLWKEMRDTARAALKEKE